MEVKKNKKFFKPYNKVNDKNVIIMWDYNPVFKKNAMGEEVETPIAIWQEHKFDYIPTLSDIKYIITEYYNNIINKKIISGLVWRNMQIWLTTENQFNYKAAYDLAIQTNGNTLPVTFKFGDNENIIYYEFKTIEDLKDFYMETIKHVQKNLKEGWGKKDSINWDFYK